jgi:hypothetical protein
MIYVNHTTTGDVACYVYEHAGETASIGVQRKWLEEVLPHYYAPSSRQRVLERLSIPPPMSADEDVELDSPPFTPQGLRDFAGRGFVRKNRWLASERKR